MISLRVLILIVSLVLTHNLIWLLDRHLSEKESPEKLQHTTNLLSASAVESESDQPVDRYFISVCNSCETDRIHDRYQRIFTSHPQNHTREYRLSNFALIWMLGLNMIALAIFIRLFNGR